MKKQKYDNEIVDVDELLVSEVKINPDYYIHNAIIKAQQALTAENKEAGFIQFRLLIDNVEILCKSAKMLPDDYTQQIEEFKEKDNDYNRKGQDFIIKQVILGNKKLELLLSEVFKAKTLNTPMRIGEVKK